MRDSDGAMLFRDEVTKPGISRDAKQEFDAEIYCDGSSLGNPGHGGIGVVARLLNKPCKDIAISEYIGIVTNNVAEYSALIRGIREARALGVKRIAVFLDSELLVKQLKGVYRVKSSMLKPLWEDARTLLRQFDYYTITHVRREFNKEADFLAKKAAERTS